MLRTIFISISSADQDVVSDFGIEHHFALDIMQDDSESPALFVGSRNTKPKESGPHPLLAQVPLTVSPFISLPTATTLPYTYKSLPSTLPLASTGEDNGTEKPKYVVSASGHAAHPDEIIASCKALQKHLQNLQDDAERTIREWEKNIKERELAEKRRVAPGWLDREEKILEPQRKRDSTITASRTGKIPEVDIMDIQDSDGGPAIRSLTEEQAAEGEELDRAFGGMGLR
ncbi:hypothetical protein MMC19_003480 [Ptychographa xylographoides]|nr:hypothetical protein [Ptychographa xylographoides]